MAEQLILPSDTNLPLVNNISFSSDEIEAFRKAGFIKIKGFLSTQAIQSLKIEANKKVISARDADSAYGDSFSRLTYDLGGTDAVKRIYPSIAFRTALVELVGHPLIMTESQSFELTPQKQGLHGIMIH